MINRSRFGSNLVEYVIPIAVIALVAGLGLYNMISSGSILSFASGSGNMEVDKSAKKGVINPSKGTKLLVNPNAGDLGGSIDNPVGQCQDGICAVDYGKFIITNIPEEFDEFIQTSGASGGVGKMADYLNKVADDYENIGEFNIANEIRLLANMGHNIALIMAEYENIYNSCSGDPVCISSFDDQPFPVPAGYDSSLLPFPAGATYKTMLDSGALGAAVNNNATSPLAGAYVSQLNKILGTGSIDNSVKGVIEELSWNIGTVGQDFQSNYLYTVGTTPTYYDPLTGAVTQPGSYTSLSNYQPSSITNVYSQLICAEGYGTDTGVYCH
jgi:hypothetical protein